MNRVVVTGLGFISSIGNSRAEVLQSLREGRCGIEVMPELAAANDRVKLAGTLKGFSFPTADPLDWTFPAHVQFSRSQLRTLVPNAVFASVAMDEAIRDAQLNPALVSSPQTGLYCASAGSSWMTHVALDSVLTRGPARTSAPTVVTGMPNSLHLNLTAKFAIKGASVGFSSACASSAHALGSACDLIRMGRQKIMFVVGAEDCHPCNILPFASLRALSAQSDPALAPRPFDVNRDGFIITGGGAALVLEDAEHAAARGATIYAEVKGWGQASDGYDVVAPDPSGAGLARAMTNALQDAHLDPSAIDYLNAHATATAAGDLAELNALKAIFTGDKSPKVSSTKALTGHGLSLAGALEAGICCLALGEAFMPASAKTQNLDPACEGISILTERCDEAPSVAMSNSSGFGGANVALIFGQA
ncbi:MAG: beta-ketoacyl-[acyl-carrier-protein] synthase family protein [Prosthecobacter sp.]|jgi:3-oxoacyl-[acyl-carrier-protein] synthase-1|uniref:beta-ketoacyl-[acyl-carrier-protein] synthase family protein n=1 Tax=Prosthecobacter sp. TaxID=1965333 RepID=UPI0019F24D1A|nr:beta-ketoacyl-[acyl-carrier-protein] synthase family protein [Prosthecobacter sp.]MBE2286979.1 beta-ketoacyl-[acyl-carrier-protein] synthase family protein [Prosthecobacter sp.]